MKTDGLIGRMLGLSRLDAVHRSAAHLEGIEFLDGVLERLDVRLELDPDELAQIPQNGPAVVVANHPFGGIEGIALARLLKSRRDDVKILANYMLDAIPQMRELFLFVDPFDRPESKRRNLAALREALRFVAAGGMLAVFPAGEVAHFNLRKRRVEDPPWQPMVASIVRRAECPVVPLFFAGRNRASFQALGLLHPWLRTALLPRELLARRGAALEARVGRVVPWRQLAGYATDEEAIDYLRTRTEILGERPSLRQRRATAVQPRITPRDVQPVVDPTPTVAMEEDLHTLRDDQHLADADELSVYVAEARQIPNLLREIGRLREITFREVGEGTGRELDLDVFDDAYLHLFIWNHAERELVGAYRLGRTDRLDKLYTSTLFAYKRKLFESMGPAIEMGRSFIRPEYQKNYTSLLLLWKGIGRYIVRHPRYTTLFGPVSISADYRSASQRLIVAFLQQNKFVHEWSEWVRPRNPGPSERPGAYRPSPAHLRNLEDVSTFISEIEADHKGVPILLKQYLRLGGRLLGFNVDPEFSDVLDVLIMVDLRQAGEKILARTMGREGAKAFLAAQRESRTEAS